MRTTEIYFILLHYCVFIIIFLSADDDECELKTDACGILGPDWICRNTLGSFRCEKKRCTGLNCKVLQSSINSTMKLIQDNQSTVKCPRGYEVDNNNKCTGIILVIYYFGL